MEGCFLHSKRSSYLLVPGLRSSYMCVHVCVWGGGKGWVVQDILYSYLLGMSMFYNMYQTSTIVFYHVNIYC